MHFKFVRSANNYISDILKLNIRTLITVNRMRRESGLEQCRRVISWLGQDFSMPAPNYVKWQVLGKWGGRKTWIETGTYTGETTSFLSKISEILISIEPVQALVVEAEKNFRQLKHVHILKGTSEEIFAKAIDSLNQEQALDVSFWLDGHYSGGDTYLGEKECPILDELLAIENNFYRFQKITIFIDDVRVLSPTASNIGGYPSLSYLSEWADKMYLRWGIEQDIFIMTNRINQLIN